MGKRSSLFARKPLDLLLKEMAGEDRLRRVLGPWQLTSLGVGSIIGTGIFVLTGVAARNVAGPALMLSFVAAGITCVFAALCYAEFASMVPVAGSAYTYAYATLGELFAWIIGWDLLLEYAVSGAAVAHGAADYFKDLVDIAGYRLIPKLADAPIRYVLKTGHFEWTGAYFDLPAVVITGLVTVILVFGIRESAGLNTAMVILKVAIVLFVIALGIAYIDPRNWTPFAPFGWTGISVFGHTVLGQETPDHRPQGMIAGAAIIFFAYIGFDSVSTHAEEARKPTRDVPIGILASLALCTVLYIAVTAVLTGMVPSRDLHVNAPVADAFARVHLTWARTLISFAAVIGIASVVLVTILSQARIFLAMARDGLIPASFFGAIHEKFRTPWKSTILTGTVVATLSALLPLEILAELVSIGTLMAFVIVCAAVLIMRRSHPEVARPFRVPFVPVIPLLGIGTCLLLMFSLPYENWIRLFVWLGIGFVIYFAYGRRHSVMSEYDEPGTGLSDPVPDAPSS